MFFVFFNEDVRITIKIPLKFVPKVLSTIFSSIVSNNGLAPTRRQQAIIWTNDGIVYWRKYASLGLNEFCVP